MWDCHRETGAERKKLGGVGEEMEDEGGRRRWSKANLMNTEVLAEL